MCAGAARLWADVSSKQFYSFRARLMIAYGGGPVSQNLGRARYAAVAGLGPVVPFQPMR